MLFSRKPPNLRAQHLRSGEVGMTALLVAVLLQVPTSALGQAPPGDPLAGLDAYIERTMKDWEIPGSAVGILKDGSVIYAKGFGVRELGRPGRVDPATVFGNGSTTKAFNAAVLGTLVDEEVLDWDDPVVEHLPWFQLYDAYATAEVTIRDLLSHRTGVRAGFYQLLQYWGSRTSRDTLVWRLRYEARAASLRSAFIYHNITYTAAGVVAETVSGRSWEDLLRERILEPLEMGSSTPFVSELSRENVSSPHTKAGGRVFAVPLLDLSNIGPAGSLNSSVEDMLKWLRMLLDDGEYLGRRVLSPEVVEAMFTPNIRMPTSNLAEPHFSQYGLGWQLGDHQGRKVALHTGSAKGFRALMTLVPEEELGFVIFSNRHVNEYPVAIMRTLLDRFLGPANAPDRSAEHLETQDEARRAAATRESVLEEERIEGTSPSLPIQSYAGPYEIDLLDPTEVRVEDGRLVWHVSPAFVAELRHWHHDVFRVERWRDPLWEGYSSLHPLVTFVLDGGGIPRRMEVEGIGAFRRVEP